MNRLILTVRDKSDCKKIRADLGDLKDHLVTDPLVSYHYYGLNISDIKKSDYLIFSSSKALKLFRNHSYHDKPIFVIGSSSKTRALKLGFKNITTSSESNIESMIEVIKKSVPKDAKLFYFRGEDIRIDLVKELESKGYDIKEQVVYKAVYKNNISDRVKNQIAADQINGVMFYSKNSLENFLVVMDKKQLTAHLKKMTIYLMSKRLDDPKLKKLFADTIIAGESTEESMINLVKSEILK